MHCNYYWWLASLVPKPFPTCSFSTLHSEKACNNLNGCEWKPGDEASTYNVHNWQLIIVLRSSDVHIYRQEVPSPWVWWAWLSLPTSTTSGTSLLSSSLGDSSKLVSTINFTFDINYLINTPVYWLAWQRGCHGTLVWETQVSIEEFRFLYVQ